VKRFAFLKNLLAAVSNPYDQVALVAVLRYWAGIPDEMLFHYTASGGELSYFVDPGTEFPRLQEAFDLLREAHQKRQQLSIRRAGGRAAGKNLVLAEGRSEAAWRPGGRQPAQGAADDSRPGDGTSPYPGGLCWLAEPDGGAGPRRGRVADSRSQQ